MDESVLEAMESYREIAPAHNPPYINGVRQFSKCMPDTPLIGLFETAFYQWAPEAAMRYGVPESWFDLGIRRWGYHGASHKFIAERSAELLKRDDVATRVRNLYVDQGTSPVENPELRVVSCHLGGSSSITGIRSGLAIGNSLGLSPQSGLPHNNRVGELDSFALPYIMKTTGISLEEAESQMCNEAGLKGLSGGYNDIRDIKQQAADGNTKARLALDVLIHQARHWIGSYTFQLNGLDALVFTAGISENNPDLRQEICNNLDQLGIQLDPEKTRQQSEWNPSSVKQTVRCKSWSSQPTKNS
jgi:acetate kinase